MSAQPDGGTQGIGDDPLTGAELFRQAFRRHAATVVVVTYVDGTGAAVRHDRHVDVLSPETPPSLLLCINKEARAHDEIAEARWLGVNLLSVGQQPIALHCSRQGSDKRLRGDWLTPDPTIDATPRLRGSLAHLECEVDTSYQAYSHTIFVALIRSVWLNPVDAPPLLYHGGLYSQLESPAERAERFHWELRED